MSANAASDERAPRRASPDRDALLAALVLVPASYSRNRFFELYRDAEVRRVRRRASMIRSVVRHVIRLEPSARRQGVRLEPSPCGGASLIYEVAELGLRRTVTLDPIELSLVRVALARAPSGAPAEGDPLVPNEHDRSKVESVLARLAP